MQNLSVPVKTDDLYALADAHGHKIDTFSIGGESLAIEMNDRCYIALNPQLHGRKEKARLAHELGHCEYGGFYNQYSDYDIISKAERRADKWAYYNLLPPRFVRSCIVDGLQPWEIAEEADLPDEFVYRCLQYYKDVGII